MMPLHRNGNVNVEQITVSNRVGTIESSSRSALNLSACLSAKQFLSLSLSLSFCERVPGQDGSWIPKIAGDTFSGA